MKRKIIHCQECDAIHYAGGKCGHSKQLLGYWKKSGLVDEAAPAADEICEEG